MLEPVTSDGIIASSLLVSGPWDQAGNSQANATQRAISYVVGLVRDTQGRTKVSGVYTFVVEGERLKLLE